jgi:hypothetical protein
MVDRQLDDEMMSGIEAVLVHSLLLPFNTPFRLPCKSALPTRPLDIVIIRGKVEEY